MDKSTHINFMGQLSVHPSAIKKEIFSARYKGMGRSRKIGLWPGLIGVALVVEAVRNRYQHL